MKVYGDVQSGNCYKIKLLLSLLNVQHRWINVDILAGESQSDEYLAINPNGKIPALVLDDGRIVTESNAILNYLAHGTELLTDDPYEYALIQQWQFFEQYSHEPYIAVARFINKYLGLPESRKAEYASKQQGGHKALAVMEQQLAKTAYLTGERLTTADISLYGYTHVAEEGGFELSAYPNINKWLKRVESQPNYINMGDG